jgi:MFS family permease
VPAAVEVPWYKSLNRKQWFTLFASNLGWLFDGYETYALILTAGPALRDLLAPSDLSRLPTYIGAVIGIGLLGWGVGGMIGGILADYIGRKRMMLFAILAYSAMTALSAIAFDWWSLALFRFLVGVAIGSEWATGSSMIAEVWPDNARGKGAGLMQCGLGIGFFIASLVWLFIAPIGAGSWRIMYVIGVLPALLTLWIRRTIPESELWELAAARRAATQQRLEEGQSLTAGERQATKFTLSELFTNPATRWSTFIVFLMSLATTVGFWSISTWVPPFVGAAAAHRGLPVAAWSSYAGMAYTAGSITGYIAFGFFADALGRKPMTMAFFALALAMTPVLFFTTAQPGPLLALAFANAIFSNGQYSWMPVWLPELYPTRMRATALAFAFNAPRFIAFLGPFLAGAMITAFGGFGRAAMVLASIYVVAIVVTPLLPETRGRLLPA